MIQNIFCPSSVPISSSPEPQGLSQPNWHTSSLEEILIFTFKKIIFFVCVSFKISHIGIPTASGIVRLRHACLLLIYFSLFKGYTCILCKSEAEIFEQSKLFPGPGGQRHAGTYVQHVQYPSLFLRINIFLICIQRIEQ